MVTNLGTVANLAHPKPKMTRNEFSALCGELLIDPGVALESDAVTEALRDGKSYQEVSAILREEF